MGLFAQHRAEIWQQLATKIGASYSPGGVLYSDRVEVHVDNWIVTLDTHQVSGGRSDTTYSCMRAPYRNPSGLRFSIHRADIFTGLGRALGFKDILIGDPDFDKSFVLSGNDEAEIVSVFLDPHIRHLLEAQPNVFFEVRDKDEQTGANLPADTDELYFSVVGTLTDIEQLKGLFNLFASVLHRLTEIHVASDDSAGIRI